MTCTCTQRPACSLRPCQSVPLPSQCSEKHRTTYTTPHQSTVDCLYSTVHAVWALHIIQRTHAIQCHCVSEGSMLSYMHPTTKYKSGKSHNSSSHGRTTASTTAAWAHLRALRDTGSTCHGTSDLGEGSSGAHACTTWPCMHTMPISMESQEKEMGLRVYVHVWGHTEGAPCTSNGHKHAGHHTDTQDACRAVNQWPTTGNWHNTTWQLTWLLVNILKGIGPNH